MKEKILKIMREVLEDNNVNEKTSQSNCSNWDSMHHLNLAVELEDAFDISLEPEEIADMKSFNDILKIISLKTK